ncbi:hypothetical protein, partial [Klebsiella aerogenes]|uniref:hypothetical protein n=1 Tax=Klebsiella aerogenes TaxID=548 RepID=UPI001954C9BC
WGLLAIIVLIVAAGRFLISVYRRRTADAPPRARYVLPAAVSRGLPPAALVFCFVYPMMIYALTGGSGALKWVDNFGVQILIY